ncbi:hypothetical protein DFH28DRAFT_18050 [Melampsora americana]|nr:hypothetical protein DFH28DRAFT_18050 [Melampsora americana]
MLSFKAFLVLCSAIFLFDFPVFSNSVIIDRSKIQLERHSHRLAARQPKQNTFETTADTGKATPKTKTTGQPASPAETAARDIFEFLIELGQELDIVTNMGTSSSDVTKHIEVVLKALPEGDKLRKAIVTAIADPTSEVQQFVTQATEGRKKLTSLLNLIKKTPDDANVIKKNFEALGEAFATLFSASDSLVAAAIGGKAGLTSQTAPK